MITSVVRDKRPNLAGHILYTYRTGGSERPIKVVIDWNLCLSNEKEYHRRHGEPVMGN